MFVLCQVRAMMWNTVVCDVGFVSGQGDEAENLTVKFGFLLVQGDDPEHGR